MCSITTVRTKLLIRQQPPTLTSALWKYFMGQKRLVACFRSSMFVAQVDWIHLGSTLLRCCDLCRWYSFILAHWFASTARVLPAFRILTCTDQRSARNSCEFQFQALEVVQDSQGTLPLTSSATSIHGSIQSDGIYLTPRLWGLANQAVSEKH